MSGWAHLGWVTPQQATAFTAAVAHHAVPRHLPLADFVMDRDGTVYSTATGVRVIKPRRVDAARRRRMVRDQRRVRRRAVRHGRVVQPRTVLPILGFEFAPIRQSLRRSLAGVPAAVETVERAAMEMAARLARMLPGDAMRPDTSAPYPLDDLLGRIDELVDDPDPRQR